MDPLHAPDDVAARKEHSADDELLHGVGVRAGRVEDDDAPLRAALDRDVVDSGAGARDGEQPLRGLNLVEVRAPHEPRRRVRGVVDKGVSGARKRVGANGGDVVHAVNGVHGPSYARCASSKSFMKLTSASTPARGMAL